MAVNMIKDSTAQKFERAYVELDRDRREDDLRTFHALFRWMGGPTIDVNHPRREPQAPVPAHMRRLRDDFLKANNS